MECHLSFRRYQRPFVKLLRTARGEWSLREGFIVRVEHESMTGYGEIAPIPEFGTETLEVAEAYLQSLAASGKFSKSVAELAERPCCAFGISAAQANSPLASKRDYPVAALLPAGAAAFNAVKSKVEQGYATFKWKIGVEPIVEEQAVFLRLLQLLPPGARLRLDANGGLSVAALENWLTLLKDHSQQIDYLEQPLPVGQEVIMAERSESFRVPIALDESLHGSGGSRWLEAGVWKGPLVVKPALMGDCGVLVERLQPVAGQVVFSSVFETGIGLENALNIADQLPELKRAIGFDTVGAFADDWMPLNSGPVIGVADRGWLNFADIWEGLSR